MDNKVQKNKIEQFVDKKEGFEDLFLITQIKYLSYWHIKLKGKNEVTSPEINELFEAISLPKPTNISDLVRNLIKANFFIRNKKAKTFSIHRKFLKKLDAEYGVNSSTDKQKVFYISGNEPWTDRNKMLNVFLSGLKGEILIVDAYYGLGTLHVLENFKKNQKVKFLTAQLGGSENADKFRSELKRFKREFKNIEFKKHAKFYELHDRYMLSDNLLVWVGHGLKDFGDKECFIVAIPREEVSEIASILKKKFNEKWKKANNLT